MNGDSGIALTELRVDGGAARNDLLMQMQADLLGVPVVRPRVSESTALGAAGLAGLAVGFWSGQDEFASKWQAERTFQPAWPESVRAARMQRWRQAVELSRAGPTPPGSGRARYRRRGQRRRPSRRSIARRAIR